MLDATAAAGELAGKAIGETKNVLAAVDDRLDVTERTQQFGKVLQEKARAFDGQYAVSSRAKSGIAAAQEAGTKLAGAIATASSNSGLTEVLRQNVIAPAERVASDVRNSSIVIEGLALGQRAYGDVREAIKPYFVPANPHELLSNTKSELSYVTACMLQISPAESSQLAAQFGRAVTAKAAGVATTTALLALVSSLGNASTGTAIATLSGAAATKATLAWVGGIVGGGMAAGAVLTGGVSIVVGLAAYRTLASERRQFETLSELEVRLIQSCWMLMDVCDVYLVKDGSEFKSRDAKFLLEQSLRPLYEEIVENVDLLARPLDNKNTIAFRQHVLTDFKRVVIAGFVDWLDGAKGLGLNEISAENLIGGMFYALMTRHPLDDSIESDLMLDALRRSRSDLASASEEELGDYLRAQPEESLKNVAENVKGIYHELAWVERYNSSHSSSYAELFPDTNHPGSDAIVRDSTTHDVLREVQLKAVDGHGHVEEHLARYPDVPVAATDEVADGMADRGVLHSGFSNEALRSSVHDDLSAIHDHTIAQRANDSALLALGIHSTKELIEMLRGERRFPDAVVNAVSKAATVAGSTALTAFLFSS